MCRVRCDLTIIVNAESGRVLLFVFSVDVAGAAGGGGEHCVIVGRLGALRPGARGDGAPLGVGRVREETRLPMAPSVGPHEAAGHGALNSAR